MQINHSLKARRLAQHAASIAAGLAAIAWVGDAAPVAHGAGRCTLRPGPTVDPPAAARSAAAASELVRAHPADVAADLFGAAPPPPPKPAPKPPVSVPAPPPPDRLAGYSYRGIVQIGDRRYALVEAETKDGQYLRAGDALSGYAVTAFDERSLTLTADGKARTLAMNDAYDLAPLGSSTASRASSLVQHNEREESAASTAATLLGGRVVNEILVDRDDQGEDIQQMKNDVFDGRMTQEEYDRRVGQTPVQLRTVELTDEITVNSLVIADPPPPIRVRLLR